jgi:hypothetical protein
MREALPLEEPLLEFRRVPLDYHHTWVETGISAGERLHPAYALLARVPKASDYQIHIRHTRTINLQEPLPDSIPLFERVSIFPQTLACSHPES